MKTSQKLLTLGVLLLVPFATAHAQPPSLSPIADVIVNAGASATVNVIAVDVSDRQITLAGSLPSFVTLNTPTIGTGAVVTTLTVAPSDIHVGDYTAAVTAMVEGESDDIAIFRISVHAEGSARAPVVIAPALREVTAGSNLSFTVEVNDPDASGITSLNTSMLPNGATFTPNSTNSSGMFNWTPGAGDAGEYDILFEAMAMNGLSGGAATHIRVASAPGLAIDPIGDVTVADGSSVSIPVMASAMAGAQIILTASLPSFATLNPPGSGTGAVSTTITVTPPIGSAGTYHASVTAISEELSVTESFDIIVTGTGGGDNRAPVLSAPTSRTVAVGSSLSFDVTASDPDGDDVDLFGSALPPGATFTDRGDNTGTFTWSPTSGQAGVYTASFTGLDNRGGSGSASTEITVTETVENRAPTLSAPATRQVDEGVALSFTVTAVDPDGDHVTLSANSLPPGAMFSDLGDNTGLFSWTPSSTQSGVYEVAFIGDDGRGGLGTASTTITVVDADEVGTCTISGDLSVCAGQTTELCGPEDADGYSWTGPGGFAASTRCVTVGAEGSYELTVQDGEGRMSTCSATITLMGCETRNCPRGPGFWAAQCAQRGNGSTKFDRAQMDEITSCVDATSDFFDWSSDFDAFCAIVDPPRPMDIRKQALRMYAVLLANVCTGKLGLVANNGESIGLDPSTEIDCDGVNGVSTVGELTAEAETQLVRLDGISLDPEVRPAYGRLKDCMDAINNGIGIGPTCAADDGVDSSENQNGNSNQDADDPTAWEGHKLGLEPSVRPNPFNPRTELSFTLSRDGSVRVTVYDLHGRLVKTLVDGFRLGGEQRVVWDGSNSRNETVPSGVYLFRIQTPEGDAVRKVIVMK
jgi:hypothetical protein